MNHIVTIVMSDPAETSDPTGIVGIEGNLITGKIHVKLARQIKDKNRKIRLHKTATYLKNVKNLIAPDFMGMETNNDGKRIIRKLKKLGITLKGISTSANLTEETKRKGFAMDKPLMVGWLVTQKEKHNILFAEYTKSDMNELIDQIAMIVSGKSPTGSTTYKAMRGRHDDLFMALLLCCHVFLLYVQRWKELHD